MRWRSRSQNEPAARLSEHCMASNFSNVRHSTIPSSGNSIKSEHPTLASAQNGQHATCMIHESLIIHDLFRQDTHPSQPEIVMTHETNASGRGHDHETIKPDTLFDPERYETHKSTIAVLMGRFMLRHLVLLYQEFEGDLLMPIILGEIAHHNIHRVYEQQGDCLKPRSDIPTGDDRLKHQESTNAFSISEATGIPRETVRRKVDKMVDKGWLNKGSRGEITITASARDDFTTDFNQTVLTELLLTSSCITDLLCAEQ